MEIEDRGRQNDAIPPKERGGYQAVIYLVFVLVFCLCASFALRTQGVLGRWVSEKIADVADRQNISIYVHTLSPAGLTGLRLHGVHGQIVVRGRVISFEAHSVDVYPLMSALIERRGVPAEILVRKGQVRVRQGEGASLDRAGARPGQGPSSLTSLTQSLKIACEDCLLEFDDGSLPSGLPLHLSVLKLDHGVLKLQSHEGRWDVMSLDALLRHESATPLRIHLSEERSPLPDGPQRILRIEWDGVDSRDLGLALPYRAGARFRVAEFDWEALQEGRVHLLLRDLILEPGDVLPVMVRFREVDVNAEGDDLRIATARGSLWSEDGRRPLGELEQVSFEITEARHQIQSRVTFHDRSGGRADIGLRWDRVRQLLVFELWFADFDGGILLRSLPEHLPLKRLHLGGAIRGEVGLEEGMIHLTTGLELRDLALHLPFLATEDLIFEKVGLGGKMLVHLPSQSISVTEGKVRFGTTAPVSLDARVVNTEPGWSFSGLMKGEAIDAARLLENLPQAMSGALREAQLEGAFDLSLKTSGLTAFPDSLVLDVSFGGDVNVTRDGHYVDVRALGSGAVPVFDSDSHRARRINASHWVSYDGLPRHIPHALLSAEDAAFFKHSGLDWVGLRMAMVHNLREGHFERGGSTISQQLAKNLFLAPNRTLSRKLQEAFLTWRIEAELDKERILELYLNVVEWGPQIHGLHRASDYYFGVHPAELEPVEMALLAAILPSPVRFGDAIKLGYLPSSRQGKMERTLLNMRFLEQLSLNEYHRARATLAKGRIGRIELRPCADDDTAPEDAPDCADVITGGGNDMRFGASAVVGIPVDTGWIPIHP